MMEQYVVAISIDKVQSFLYYVLQASEQEKQSNSGTLKTIIGSSRLISEDFYEEIGVEGEQGSFASHIDMELLKCSGMCIFVTSLSEKELTAKLDELFETYYLKLNGQLLLKYTFFTLSEVAVNGEIDRLQAIKKGKKQLKEKSCLNGIIDRNKDLLFKFHSIKKKVTEKQNVKVQAVTFNAFTENINALYSEQEATNDNHFRIAVIKADLDGMGDMLSQLQTYDEYHQISTILSKYICIEYLHQKVIEFVEKDASFRMYPLYIAGDDIFIAVPVSKLMDGVNVCRAILNDINYELAAFSQKHPISIPPLSMSVGIEFTFNREPIRYYYNRVQQQLDVAKKAEKIANQDWVDNLTCTKISMNNYVFYDYKFDAKEADTATVRTENSKKYKGKSDSKILKMLQDFKDANEDKSQWHHFVSQVKRIQQAMHEGFAAHHFFYTLLEKLAHDDIRNNSDIRTRNIRYSNAFLYHVIPQYQNSHNKLLRELELLILESLVQQVIVKNSRQQGELSFTSNRQNKLENYVRLLLLFADSRFDMMKNTTIKQDQQKEEEQRNRVRRTIFNKTLRFLYEYNLGKRKNDTFRDIFVKFTKYTTSNDDQTVSRGGSSSGSNEVEVYRVLPLSTSLLHRLKTITDKRKVANLIEATNPQSKEEVEELEKDRQEQHKAPPKLYFNKAEFLKLAESQNNWNNDYIDSLLIFYQLREQLIQFRVDSAFYKTKTAPTRANKNAKHNSNRGKRK
ncbi:Cas10/Cmr2 second palm domain-containing protein [Paenibacillus sp. SGZ-1009]|uniref:Cas10/Cmr2 second palm domain-containing protein n=1 Tax=Paenibacillus campi TaxID=3106031 RepID=UPI002AFF02B6|nr:hypothetical protein [Paenibacillus sp. SGZ-1009]